MATIKDLAEQYGVAKAQDQNENLGRLAEMLGSARDIGNEYKVPSWVPLAGGAGAGDLLMGKTPEEIENWSYGNAPMQIPEMSNVPQFKRGRAQSLADALTTLAPGVKATEGLPVGLSFIGPKSRNWDKVAAELAAKKLDEGADPAEVWREHLIGRMPDKTLFSEIDDSKFRLSNSNDYDAMIADKRKAMAENIAQQKEFESLKNAESPQLDLYPKEFKKAINEKISNLKNDRNYIRDELSGDLGLEHGLGSFEGQRARNAFQHPDLINAYPELTNDSIIKQNRMLGSGVRGQLSGTNIDLSNNLLDYPDEAASTALHEFQHAIQNHEGWGKGSNPLTSQSDYYNFLGKKFKDIDGSNILSKFNELSGKSEPYYRIKQIQDLQNISQPRQLFNSSDYYKYSRELKDLLGAPPKYGSKLPWAQDAGNIIANKIKDELTWNGKDLLESIGNDRDFAKKMIRSIEGKQNRIGYDKYSDAYKTSQEMQRTDPRFKDLPNEEKMKLYQRSAGEAQARATQDRLDMDMAQRRENYPLAGGKLSDIPLEELIYKYEGNGPSLSADPLSKYKDYVGEHSAPLGDSGAPLHDLTANKNSVYPSDVYSSQANQYYGSGEPEDAQLFAMAQRLKDKPNEKVSIYRAVPKMQSNSEKAAQLEKDLANYMKRGRMPSNSDFNNKSDWYEWASNERDRLASLPEETLDPLSINHGDWVALDKKYAKEHGESALGGNYKILSKKVPARQLFTNGDSIREWGWDSRYAEGGEVDLSDNQQMKAIPQQPNLARLAELLQDAKSSGNQYSVPDWVPLLGGSGAGDMLLGNAPEEIENWSYGDMPMRVPEMSNVPQFKQGRAQSLADTAMLLAGPAESTARNAMAGNVGMIIKPKGGNWLDAYGRTPEKSASQFGRSVDPELEGYARAGMHLMPHEYNETVPKMAVNDWLKQKLAKYIQNEMGTPEDPIRRIAEEWPAKRDVLISQQQSKIPNLQELAAKYEDMGLPPEVIANRMANSQRDISGIQDKISELEGYNPLHYTPKDPGEFDIDEVMAKREAADYPAEGIAKTNLGKLWEHYADENIQSMKVYDVNEMMNNKMYKEMNPWLKKLNDEDQVYLTNTMVGTGFDKLADELRNAAHPDTDLPDFLRIDPDKLSRVSMPQAVEHVAKINAWRDAERLKEGRNSATVMHKEYPDQGLSWMQMKMPEPTFLEGHYLGEDSRGNPAVLDASGGEWSSASTPEEALAKYRDAERRDALKSALKFEGDTMGHCVGQYCDEVGRGDSNIYSLRDRRGEPHVTIETKGGGFDPNKFLDLNKQIINDDSYLRDKLKYLQENYANRPERQSDLMLDAMKKYGYEYQLPETMEKIVQIKGKQNAAPNAKYMPAVHDFVRSKDWSSVGDLDNTYLYDLSQPFLNPDLQEMVKNKYGKFATDDEINSLMDDHLQKNVNFADGGLVGGSVDAQDDEGYLDDLDRLKKAYERSNFGPNDSVIASTIHHPIEAAKRYGQHLNDMYAIATDQLTDAELAAAKDAGYDEESYPLYAMEHPIFRTDAQKAEAGMEFAGLAQTGAMPFAPESAGGVLGSILRPNSQLGTIGSKREKKPITELEEGVKLGKRISTATPTEIAAKKMNYHSTPEHIITLDTMRSNPEAFEKNMKLMSEYMPFNETDTNKQADLYRKYIGDNLRYFVKNAPEDFTQRSGNWYKGANALANDMSNAYNIPIEASAGVLARLSPQQNWLHNVEQADRVADIFTNHQNTVMPVGKYKGTKLKDLPDSLSQAEWIKDFDQHTTRNEYYGITPEGALSDEIIRTKTGEPSTFVWQSFPNLSRAVDILKDPSIENVSKSLGLGGHKIRNFYNNMADPFHPEDVTIDTHAGAAALFTPYSASAIPIGHLFGGGAKKGIVEGSSKSGMAHGMYGLYADTYRDVAKDLNLPAQSLQSQIWELVRETFPTMGKEKMQKQIQTNVLDELKKGKITEEEARNKILDIATKGKGFLLPDWYTQDYAKGGEVSMDDLHFNDDDALRMYHQEMDRMGDKISNTGASKKTGKGTARVNYSTLTKGDIGKEIALHTLMANYGVDVGDLNLDAGLIKPMEADGLYIGDLTGSLPLGEGRASLGVQGMHSKYDDGLSGYTAGYNGKVGDGNLSARYFEPADHNSAGRQVQLEYALPFAKGGSVQALHNKYEESDYGYGNRPDKTKKGLGYFGELERPDGTGVMTEYSIGVPINGEEMDVPTLIPTLTPDEIRLILHMQDGEDMPRSIVHKAIDHAHQRLSEGKPIFATEEDLYAHGGIVDVLHNDAIEQIMKAFMDSMEDEPKEDEPAAVSIQITTQSQPLKSGKIPTSIREAKHG